MTITTTINARRPLAAELRQTRGQGIAVFVQERVHSTTIGLAATEAFVTQLVAELESAVEEIAVTDLSDDQEIELGTLISASSLTIRYATEREAIFPVLGRLRAAFHAVLEHPMWTKPFLGLKMVALMGCTRSLEAFGEHVPLDEVVADLRSFLALCHVDRASEDTTTVLEPRANYLLRPVCEFVTVAMQSHPACHAMITSEIVPQLLESIVVVTSNDESAMLKDAVKSELATTIAVILDMKLPEAPRPPFGLLPMPRFAESIQLSEEEDENVHLLRHDDNCTDHIALPDNDTVHLVCETLVSWLALPSLRICSATIIPLLANLLQLHGKDALVELLTMGLVRSLSSSSLQARSDFEFCQSVVEALRDLSLRKSVFPMSAVGDAFHCLKSVMPRLQASLKVIDVDKAQLKMIKATCSVTRESLVEAFVAWIHIAGETQFGDYNEEFLGSVVEKLADPRIYGDCLYITKRTADVAAFETAVGDALRPLVRAVSQLDRYTKAATIRIVAGIARIAVAVGESIVPYADDLVDPIVASIRDGKVKGKTQRLYLVTIGTVALGCAQSQAFEAASTRWMNDFLHVLLDMAASSNVFGLNILNEMIQTEAKIGVLVAHRCIQDEEVVAYICQKSLAAWPVFEEDVDAKLLTLELIKMLLRENPFRAALNVAALKTTLIQLTENAQNDAVFEVAEASKDVLQALQNKL